MSSLKSRKSVNIPLILAMVLLLPSLAANAFLYNKYKGLKTVSSKTIEQKNKEYVAKIGKV
jgi:hypothetical protein